MKACSGEPISWLRLERYALRELPEAEQSEVARHLAACPVCSECLARIERDQRVFELMPRAISGARPARRIAPRWGAWPVWLGVASAAAIALLLVRPSPSAELLGPVGVSSKSSVKGGDFALELVRVDAAGHPKQPTHFGAGDRWKAVVTCPPGWTGALGVAVYQDGQAYLPLAVQEIDDCGNRRTLPGAFELDGTHPARVCASAAASSAEWSARIERGGATPPAGSVCIQLEPDAMALPR